MQVNGIKKGKYTLGGKLEFETDSSNIEMDVKGALEIAYTLFDWAGFDYTVLEHLEDYIEKKGN